MINREIGIMIRCNHPTIINLIGYSFKDFHGENNITIIMELAKKGSLAELLQKSQNGLADDIYDNTIRQIILIGVARGMMYLHEHKIIHRDLKPGNILLDEDFHPHITDFGLSKLSENLTSISQSQQCGTTAYMAPEVIEGNKFSGKADVYSFGILMYEVITDLTPYPELNKGKCTIYKFNNMVINEDHRPIFKFPIKKSIQKLIERCWSKYPNERPTFEEIFKKLAYNIEDEVDDIYDESQYLEKKGDIDDDNKYYLEGVDVDDIASYIDDIDFQEIQTNKEELTMKNLDNERLMNYIKKLENSMENMKEKFNQLQIENKQQKDLFDDVVKNKFHSIMKENEELKKKIKQLQIDIENQKKKFDNEILMQLDLIKTENEQIKKENIKMKEKLSKLEIKSGTDIIKSKTKNDSFTKPSSEKVDDVKSIKSTPSKKTEVEKVKSSSEKVDKKDSDDDKSIKPEEEKTKDFIVKSSKKSNKMPKIDTNYITIDNFNGLSLQLQKYVISQLVSLSNGFFKKVDEFLDYLLNFCSPVSKNIFRINMVNKSAILSNFNLEENIFLLYPATTILIKKNSLNTPDFSQLILKFNQVTIEFKYPSKHFDKYYRNIVSFKNLKRNIINIRILISEIEKTDDIFRNSDDINSIIIDSSVKEIESKKIDNVYYGSFSNCSALNDIIIPYSVNSIGPFSFDKCISLQQIDFPSSLKEISQFAFRGCNSLKKVTLSNYCDVKRIGMSAFSGCSSLVSFEIPLKVTIIERNTFYGCSSLVQIKIHSEVTKIEASAFSGCSALVQIQIPDKVTVIESSAFNGCSSLNKIQMPPNLHKIEAATFKGCKSLNELAIPKNVTEIEKSAFFGCSTLMKISIPDSVKSIGFGAFTDCSSLEEITIPSNVNSIGEFCFKNCTKLSKVSIDENKTKISKTSFKDCKLLQMKH